MPKHSFPGWGDLAPIFKRMVRETPNSRIHPIVLSGEVHPRDGSDPYPILEPDSDVRPDGWKWLMENRHGTLLTSMPAQLIVMQEVAAFVLFAYVGGDADESRPLVDVNLPILMLPVPVSESSMNSLRLLATKERGQVIFRTRFDKIYAAGVDVMIRFGEADLNRALEHTRKVRAGGVGIAGAAHPDEPILPLGPPAEPVYGLDQLEELYARDRHGAMRWAAARCRGQQSVDVLTVMAHVGNPEDVGELAFQAAEGDGAEAAELLAGIAEDEPLVALDALLSLEPRSIPHVEDEWIHRLAARAPERVPVRWVDAGRFDDRVRQALARASDRESWLYGILWEEHRLGVPHARRVDSDLTAEQVATEIAAGHFEETSLGLVAGPRSGLTPDAALRLYRKGLKVGAIAAADGMADDGWEPHLVCEGLAESSGAQLAWRWLRQRLGGPDLVTVARRARLAPAVLVELAGPKRRQAADRLRGLGVPRAQVVELLVDAGVDAAKAEALTGR